jgi:hypothetical protein
MSLSTLPQVRENSSPYGEPPAPNLVCEISLRTAFYSDWLRELPGAHRLVQTLLQGQILGHYDLLDFLIWPEGVFTRISLKGASSLADFLKFLREKSTPVGTNPKVFWSDELRWIKLVTPEQLNESTRLFLQRADQIRREVSESHGSAPNLFFFYRDPRLPR